MRARPCHVTRSADTLKANDIGAWAFASDNIGDDLVANDALILLEGGPIANIVFRKKINFFIIRQLHGVLFIMICNYY